MTSLEIVAGDLWIPVCVPLALATLLLLMDRVEARVLDRVPRRTPLPPDRPPAGRNVGDEWDRLGPHGAERAEQVDEQRA